MSARDELYELAVCGDDRTANQKIDAFLTEELAELARLFEDRGRSRLDGGIMTAADAAQLIRQHAAGKDTSGAQAPADESTQPAPDLALPWAADMDDSDLHLFLGDLVAAAMGRWQSDPEVPDREVLAAVEKACAGWRTPGMGLRSDEDERAAPDFFQVGHTYCDSNGYRAPELVTHFRVECVARHPERGTLRAIGWMRNGAPGARWRGNFQDEGEFAGWTDITEDGDVS